MSRRHEEHLRHLSKHHSTALVHALLGVDQLIEALHKEYQDDTYILGDGQEKLLSLIGLT